MMATFATTEYGIKGGVKFSIQFFCTASGAEVKVFGNDKLMQRSDSESCCAF